MTRQFNGYGEPTEFSNWLRAQKAIASNKGYVATNIDYLWGDKNSKNFMLIEEKRHGRNLSFSQGKQFLQLHRAINDPNYCGFYRLIFQNTSPEDGKIWISHVEKTGVENLVEVSKDELINFLQFRSDLLYLPKDE